MSGVLDDTIHQLLLVFFPEPHLSILLGNGQHKILKNLVIQIFTQQKGIGFVAFIRMSLARCEMTMEKGKLKMIRTRKLA